MVYVVALIIDALAPSFGGEKNQVQALKTVAYGMTSAWVAGIALIVPVLGWLVALAGGIYSIYLIYLGLPSTMKAPQEKAGGYTAVTIIIAIVLKWICGLIVAGAIGTGMVASGALGGVHLGGNSGSATIDPDSALGKLAAAGQRMEAAQKSGDADAQAKAVGAAMTAALGGGDQVEALSPDLLKPFVPSSLGGLPRTDFSAEKNGALGMQVSEAHATYSDNASGRSLRLEVTDMGSAKGLMAMAGWAALQQERETEHGYEKTYKVDGRLVHEEWNSQDKHGEYGIVLGDRFSVKLTGEADSMDQLKAAVASINLAGLEALKAQGVKKG
jgi:hypothetical protein